MAGGVQVGLDTNRDRRGAPESPQRREYGREVELGTIDSITSVNAGLAHQPMAPALARGDTNQTAGQENTNRLVPPKNESKGTSVFLLDTYPRSQHPQFFSEVERLVPTSKTITLIAIGLNLLWEKHILDILIRRAKSGEAKVTICMGNPYNPHIKSRWIEESQLQRPRGKHGTRNNLQALLEQIADAGDPANIRVLVFEHYPTFATLIFDDHIFFYPYAYQLVGNNSPIFHIKNDNRSDEVRFFLENAERIVSNSVPAKDVINARLNRRYCSDNWISVAVYIVPEKESTFYQFGSSILGYDVHSRHLLPVNTQDIKELRKYVGKAETFGFHATLADALFFVSEKELERVKAEVRDLCEELKPFKLSNLRLTDQFREGDDLVVLCDDESGTTEILHHELVSRVYSHAISSNYRTGRTHNSLPTNKRTRAELMIDWYGAPYILNDFVLHFTLCSDLPGDNEKKKDILRKAREMFEAQVKESALIVDEICVMIRRGNDSHWKICASYPLSKE